MVTNNLRALGPVSLGLGAYSWYRNMLLPHMDYHAEFDRSRSTDETMWVYVKQCAGYMQGSKFFSVLGPSVEQGSG